MQLPVYSCAAGKLETYPWLAEMALRFLDEGTVVFHTNTRITSFLILNRSLLSTIAVTIAHTTTSVQSTDQKLGHPTHT